MFGSIDKLIAEAMKLLNDEDLRTLLSITRKVGQSTDPVVAVAAHTLGQKIIDELNLRG